MYRLIIGILGIILLCNSCAVATKGYVSTELDHQQKKIESSARALDSLFVSYRVQIDSNKQQLARLTEQQQTLKTSARVLDSLLTNYQVKIDTNAVRLTNLLTAYDVLKSEMQVIRKIDIPDLQARDQQFETLTANLISELETLSRQSLRELAAIIETYLEQTDFLTTPETVPILPGSKEAPTPDLPEPAVQTDTDAPR